MHIQHDLQLVATADTILLGSLSFGRFRQQLSMYEGNNTTLSDSNILEEIIEFVIITHSQRNVARIDSAFLVISGGVSC